MKDANIVALADRIRAAGFTVNTVHECVSEDAAAVVCERNQRTLANWRSKGTGPRWEKRHGRVRYPVEGLIEWLDAGDEK